MGKHQDLDVEGDIATQLDELKTVVPKFKKVAAEVSKYIKAIAAIQAAETRVQEALSELGRPPPKCPRRVKDMRSAVVKGSECLRKCQQLHWNQVDVLESDLIPAIEAVVQDASKTQSALEKELKEGKAKATQEIKKEEKKLQKLEKKHGKATDDRTDSDVIDQHGVVEDSKTALQDFLDTFYEKVLDEHRARFSKVVGALVNYGGSALNKYMKASDTAAIFVDRTSVLVDGPPPRREDTSSVSGSGEEDMNGAGRDTMNSRHTALDDAVVDDVDVDAHGGDGGDAFGRGPRLDRRGDSPSRRTPSDKLFGIDSEDIMPHGHPKKKLPAGARPVFPFEHDDDPSAGFQRSKLPDHYQDRPEHYTTTDDEDRDRGDEGDDGGVLDAEARRVERRRRERRRSSSREASALDQRGLEAQLSQPSPRGRRAGKKGRRGRNRMRSRSGGGSALDDDDDDDDDGAVVAGAGDVRLSGEETTSSASSSSSSSDEDEEEDAVARKRSFFFRGRKKTKKQKEKEKEKERKRKEKEERRSASRMSKATTKASKRSGADDDDDDDDDDDADEHARGNRVRAAAGYERYALPEDSPAPRRKSRFRSLSPRFGRRKVSPHSRAGDDDGDHHHRRPRNERNEDRDRRREQRGPEHLWEDERMLPRGGGGGRARARAPGGGGRRLRGVYDDGRDDGYDPVMDAARYPPPPLDRRGGGGRAGPVPGRRERLPPRDRDPYRRPASLSPSRFHHRAMMPYDDDDDLLPPPPSARHHPMPRDDALMMRRVAAEEDELMRRRRAAAGGGGGGERMRHRDVHRPRHAAPPPGEPLPPPTRRAPPPRGPDMEGGDDDYAVRAGLLPRRTSVRFGGPGGPGGGAYLHDDRRPMPGPPRDAWAGRSAEGLRAGEYRVLYAYRPTDPNQLELAVGDVVRVKGDPQENWQYGFNTRNQRSGWFPRTYLDFTNDQEAADRLRRNREMPMSPGHQSQLPHVPAPDY